MIGASINAIPIDSPLLIISRLDDSSKKTFTGTSFLTFAEWLHRSNQRADLAANSNGLGRHRFEDVVVTFVDFMRNCANDISGNNGCDFFRNYPELHYHRYFLARGCFVTSLTTWACS